MRAFLWTWFRLSPVYSLLDLRVFDHGFDDEVDGTEMALKHRVKQFSRGPQPSRRGRATFMKTTVPGRSNIDFSCPGLESSSRGISFIRIGVPFAPAWISNAAAMMPAPSTAALLPSLLSTSSSLLAFFLQFLSIPSQGTDQYSTMRSRFWPFSASRRLFDFQRFVPARLRTFNRVITFATRHRVRQQPVVGLKTLWTIYVNSHHLLDGIGLSLLQFPA
ncbi:hypothetical protein ACVBEG_27035 [Pseudomonas sp. GG8]